MKILKYAAMVLGLIFIGGSASMITNVQTADTIPPNPWHMDFQISDSDDDEFLQYPPIPENTGDPVLEKFVEPLPEHAPELTDDWENRPQPKADILFIVTYENTDESGNKKEVTQVLNNSFIKIYEENSDLTTLQYIFSNSQEQQSDCLGLAVANRHAEKSAVFLPNGQRIPQLDGCSFTGKSVGNYAIFEKDGLYGLFDFTITDFIIPIQYLNAELPDGETCFLKTGENTGKIVELESMQESTFEIPWVIDTVFYDPSGMVLTEEGYVNLETGEALSNENYTKGISNFIGNYALAKNDTGNVVIDRNGETIQLDFSYDDIFLSFGKIVYKNGRFLTILDEGWKPASSPISVTDEEKLTFLDDSIMLLTGGIKTRVVRWDGEEIIAVRSELTVSLCGNIIVVTNESDKSFSLYDRSGTLLYRDYNFINVTLDGRYVSVRQGSTIGIKDLSGSWIYKFSI